MASDLSTLIEDGLCSTLTSLLAKEATLKTIHKAATHDLDNIQTLSIESTFEFDKITSTWNFIIPAYSASYIFNCMLGDESEPVLEIDADIADAIGEFISNVSGGLSTAINGAGFDDLSGAKFSIVNNEIKPIDSIDSFDNMFKFTIDLDGKEILIFIQFDNVILPFIEHINASPQSEPPEIEDISNEIDLNEIENLDLEIEEQNIIEPPKEEIPVENIEPQIEEPKVEEKKEEIKEDKKEDVKELTPEEKKAKKLKLIIIGVGVTLGLVIISAVVMYFLGWFDPPPPPPKEDQNITKKNVDKNGIEVVGYSKKKSNFDISTINVRRLNARLALLTKYSVLGIDEIQAQKEQQKKYLEKIKKEEELLKFAQKNKEEDIFTKKDTSISKKDIVNKTKKVVANKDNNKLKFVSSYILKYKPYKQLLINSHTISGRISICNDLKNNTIIYMGPFETDSIQNTILRNIKSNYDVSVKKTYLTKEQFNSRCDF